MGPLVVGGDGALYGVLTFGTLVVYRITTDGVFSLFANLSTLSPGVGAINTGLVHASDGNFYGIGSNRIYEVTSGGSVVPLYTFGTIAEDGFEGARNLLK